jgi:hypothetical protein
MMLPTTALFPSPAGSGQELLHLLQRDGLKVDPRAGNGVD